MKWRGSLTNLLWFDGFSALTAGIVLLVFRVSLSNWLELPLWLLTFQGITNLVYATYSMSLARRKSRPFWMLKTLVVGNLAYAIFSLIMLLTFFRRCNIYGKMLFAAEVLYIGGLAWLEWTVIKNRSLEADQA